MQFFFNLKTIHAFLPKKKKHLSTFKIKSDRNVFEEVLPADGTKFKIYKVDFSLIPFAFSKTTIPCNIFKFLLEIEKESMPENDIILLWKLPESTSYLATFLMLRFYRVPISVFFSGPYNYFELLPSHQIGSFTFLLFLQCKIVALSPLTGSLVLQSEEVILVRFCLLFSLSSIIDYLF